jgi:hypothetical protein
MYRLLLLLVAINSISFVTSVSHLQLRQQPDRQLRSLQQQTTSNDNGNSTDNSSTRHDDSPPNGTDIVVIIEDPFNTGRDLLTVGGFVESDQCWIYLDSSDLNSDGRISNEEYVGFAKLLTDNVLSNQLNIEMYDDLPLVFQLAFSSTACLCQNPLAGGNADDTECCTGDNAHIRIPVQPSNNPNTTEANYLYTACSLTQGAGEVYLTSDAPTTVAPVVTSSPPTIAPLAVPVAPTGAPVAVPDTGAPIIAPVATPTLVL